MAAIRLNIDPATGQARLHGGGGSASQALGRAAASAGPARRCPQRLIFGDDAGWPAMMGLGGLSVSLGVTFGWRARGPLKQVFARAGGLGGELARVIALLQRVAPHRPLHLIAHSMGAEVALNALAAARAHSLRG